MGEKPLSQLSWIDSASNAAPKLDSVEEFVVPPQSTNAEPASFTSPPATLAPMLRQYLELKEKYREHVILFQVGDFYEIFFDDARTVSDALSIRLTSRDKNNPDPIPMCGVPVHAIDTYLPRMLKAGLSCVVVDQAGEVSEKKGPVRREIARVVTPGVRLEGDGLESIAANYLGAALFAHGSGVLVLADVSTGSFHVHMADSADDLVDAVLSARPAELLVPSLLFSQKLDKGEGWLKELRDRVRSFGGQLRFRPFPQLRREDLFAKAAKFFAVGGDEELSGQLSSKLSSLSREHLAGIDAVLEFVSEVTFGRLPRFSRLLVTQRARSVFLDNATYRNLEISETRADGDTKNSLLGRINYTRTAMGYRLLSEWIAAPSSELSEITARHDAVEELVSRGTARETLREALAGVRDIERLLSRIVSPRGTPRDLGGLRDSIEKLPLFFDELRACSSELIRSIAADFDPLPDLHSRLEKALVEDPPSKATEGGIFRPGYSGELDTLVGLQREAKNHLSALEAAERERTGISGLKIRYTGVFGYFIEVTKTHLSKIPPDFERKQTLANAERFVTPALKEFERRALSAQGEQLELEGKLFSELKEQVEKEAARVQKTAGCLALSDVLLALAELAALHGYSRPKMLEDSRLSIAGGRHPVVERVLGEEKFIPNDTLLDGDGRRFAVLTGPNMGGKSTYLRQVALIQLLAQIGSFVPAKSAELGVVDRIFTRIGAADDLARGDSTFMVEMREAAVIAKKATARSLVLIDEIGRGTATTDGLALATAIAEWLLDVVRCKTIFATHFHELTELGTVRDGALCLSVGAVEDRGELSFTHRIEERVGDRSYGLEVAKLAGLPAPLVARADEVLRELLARAHGEQVPETAATASPFAPVAAELLRRLEAIDTNAMTPVQALLELQDLQQLIRVR